MDDDYRTYLLIFCLGLGVFALSKKGREHLIELRDKGLITGVILIVVMVAGTPVYIVLRLLIDLIQNRH